LEKCLAKVIDGAERVAAWCNERDERNRRLDEEARRLKNLEAVVAECHRRADAWHAAQRVLAFVDAVAAANPQAEDTSSDEGALVAFLREQMQARVLRAVDIGDLKIGVEIDQPPSRLQHD
jgi:hypothetical protein